MILLKIIVEYRDYAGPKGEVYSQYITAPKELKRRLFNLIHRDRYQGPNIYKGLNLMKSKGLIYSKAHEMPKFKLIMGAMGIDTRRVLTDRNTIWDFVDNDKIK